MKYKTNDYRLMRGHSHINSAQLRTTLSRWYAALVVVDSTLGVRLTVRRKNHVF